MDRDTWGFSDAADAEAYLGDVGRLWLGWIVGLAVLVLLSGWVVVAGGVGVMVLLIWLIRPLQARAERLVPEAAPMASGKRPGWGSARERTMRKLAYGEEPIAAAVALSGAGRWWLAARRLMIVATVAAVAVVLWTAAGSGT